MRGLGGFRTGEGLALLPECLLFALFVFPPSFPVVEGTSTETGE